MSELGMKNNHSGMTGRKKKLNWEIIHDILVCEPITEKGNMSLMNLGLTNDVSIPFFFDNLIVNAHYLVSKQNADPGYGHLFYQYTLEQNQQDAIEDNNQIFERQLIDDIDYGQPLLLLGVAGNGKTIAVFRQMYTSGKLNGITDKKVTYIDLDEGKTKIRYGLDYKCKGKKPYEMFGLSILEHIIEYLRKIDSGFINLKTNHYKYFVQYNNSTPFYDELFDNIALYKKEDRTTETRVFQCVIDEIEKDVFITLIPHYSS